jgi:hypothetical protein
LQVAGRGARPRPAIIPLAPFRISGASCPSAAAALSTRARSAGFFKIERRVMSEAMDIMLKIGITETVSAGKLSNGDLRQRRR